MRAASLVSIIFSLSLASGLSLGATTSTSFQVTATVQKYCVVATPNTLAFGNYDGSAAVPATTDISVTCTIGTGYDIGLDEGDASGATVSTRQMEDSGGHTLSYGLYSDASHTTNWGNTVSTDTVHDTGTGSAIATTVYGLIPSGQFAAPGNYDDTISVTVTY